MEVNKNDITPFEKELEKEMINGIIEYLKYGKEPKNNVNSYMNAYTLAKEVADSGNDKLEALYEYHNRIISSFINFSFQNISK